MPDFKISGVPVCPHAGGVGLCEYVQHVSIFDYIRVSGSLERRTTAYVDHLHEHFLDPCVVRRPLPGTARRRGEHHDEGGFARGTFLSFGEGLE